VKYTPLYEPAVQRGKMAPPAPYGRWAFRSKKLNMSFLNWFFGKPAAALPPGPKAALRSEHSRLQRHARREQLYVGIREAMTRAGVLSASYKFKVLSLDQPGDKFMVMMDLAKGFRGPPRQLTEMEALIIQNAKARFEITVPAVYWRLDELVAAPSRLPAKLVPPRHEPLQADEVAAFKQALLADSPQGALVAARDLATRRGLHAPADGQLTGFEDTEMPCSATVPALSNTQYGDLN